MTNVVTSTGEHTVTVDFDDEKASLDAITKALGEAGYTVGEPTKL